MKTVILCKLANAITFIIKFLIWVILHNPPIWSILYNGYCMSVAVILDSLLQNVLIIINYHGTAWLVKYCNSELKRLANVSSIQLSFSNTSMEFVKRLCPQAVLVINQLRAASCCHGHWVFVFAIIVSAKEIDGKHWQRAPDWITFQF